MAKERPEKDAEVSRKEKKVSGDKIKKKEMKVKKESKLKTELEHRPKRTQEGGTAQLAQTNEVVDHTEDQHDEHDPYSKKEEKKRRRKEERLHEKVLDRLMEQEIGPSPTAAGKHVEVESERKNAKKAARKLEKKAEKALLKAAQAAEATAKATAPNEEPMEGESTEEFSRQKIDSSGLFMFDTNPTKVERPKVDAANRFSPHTENTMEAGEFEQLLMNRAARRRLKLIARQKEAIQKKLGVEVGSTEPNEQVDTELNMWIVASDAKTAQREAKKKERKKREEKRLERRKGRLLQTIKENKTRGRTGRA